MTDVVMPQMGESIVEGTLTKWLKKPGEHVERDEPLFEISTDKVDTEIPAPVAGTLSEVLVEEGKTVGINTVVGRINEAGGDGARPQAPAQQRPAAPPAAATPPQRPAPSPPAQTSPPAPSAASAPVPNAHAAAQGQEPGVRPGMGEPDIVSSPPPAPEAMEPAGEPQGPLSPLVRRMARENNIDLNGVKGTGAGGRITKQDVDAYIAQQKGAPAAQPQQQAPGARPAAPAPYSPPTPAQAKTRVEPMSTMRMKIAEHMMLSQRVSAHVTTVHK